MSKFWTNVELTALLEDEDSCVYLERVQKHVGLHPFQLTDLNAALRDMLNANLNFFDAELNGLVLAYRNTKLLSPMGYILYDTCYVHVDIEADFYIFRPEVGRSLKGFVNKKSTNHIGILVHKVFNVSVPKPDDDEADEVENQISWSGDNVSVGQEVRFTLEKLDYTTRIPYIRGVLKEDEYLSGCHLFNEQIADTCESEFQKVARWSTNGEDQDDKRKVKNQKENKKIIFNSDSEVEIDPDSGPDKKKSIKKLLKDSDVIEQSPKKSKKRKRKSTSNSETEAEMTEQSDKEQKSLIKKGLLNNSNGNEFLVPTATVKKRKKNPIEHDNSSTNLDNGIESDVLKEKIKNHKKKSKRNKIDNDTEDEKEQKSLIKTLIIDPHQNNTVSKENQVTSPKLLKKSRKNMNGTSDTEDEKQFKLTINKNIVANGGDIVDAKSESDLSKKRKKRKRSLDEKPALEDTNDHKNTKPLVENVFQLPESLPKKRKRKHSINEMADDSEAERKYKKSLISNLLVNVESKETSNLELKNPKVLSTKEKKHAVKDDLLMDTEDERNYKSSLKPLVQSLQTDNQGNDVTNKKHKKKRDKHKHKSSNILENDPEFNPLLVKVKDEPESEIEGKRCKREKQSMERTTSVKNNIDSTDELNKHLKKKRKKLDKERKSISEQCEAESSLIKVETLKTEKTKISGDQNDLSRSLIVNENSEVGKKKHSVQTLVTETIVTDIKTEEEEEAKKHLSKKKHNKDSSK